MKDILRTIVLGGLFAVPLLTLYVADGYFFPYITGKNFWFRILVDITVAAWVLLALYDVRYRPRFSWIFVSFSGLLIVMFFANLLGEHRISSFWSNYERMDGYVSLVHTFLYMVVLGSILKTKEDWGRILHTSLGVSFLVALYGLAQYSGLAAGNGRIDSTLGNAAYMAVYMLFHIFIAFWLFVESKNKLHKIIYGILAAMFTFVLIGTGTRGTAIGLAVGILVMSGYVGLFGSKFVEFRKYAIGAFALLVIGVAGFVMARDSALVQSNPNLARIANISINDLAVRGTIWSMAWEGVKERPLLGWGQSNFNYVFNEQYRPALYAQEQWFDRSHNIIMDWLIAGGFLGLIAYFSLFAACLYYLFLSPLLNKDDERFTVLERGVLLGILAGYLTHNFVVFDNIVSYIFFAIILGLIHARVSEPIKELEKAKVDEAIIVQFATPVVGALLIGVIYFAYIPGMAAAKDIIQAISSPSPEARLSEFEEALSRDSFGRQEIVEQLSQNAVNIIRDQKVSAEVKQKYGDKAEEELLALAESKPGDARVHVFIATFYRATSQLEKAAEQMAMASRLSPKKQSIMIQQGFIALSLSKNEEAKQFFEEAYKLDTRNLEAREYYAGALFYTNQGEEAKALMDSDVVRARFAQSDFLLGAANKAGENEFLLELFKTRLEAAKDNAQNWATLAFLYHETGNKEAALKTLEDAKLAVPSFAKTATCISENIKNNRTPDQGCIAAPGAGTPAAAATKP